jgi:hypothetical protein
MAQLMENTNSETGAILEFIIENGQCIRRDTQTGEQLDLSKITKLVLYTQLTGSVESLNQILYYEKLIKHCIYYKVLLL